MDKPMLSHSALAPAVNALCVRLREAIRTQSWSALTRIDAEIAQLLKGQPVLALTVGDQAAVGQLRRAHQQALEACERELARLTQVLTAMRENRDGWQAYVDSHAWTPLLPSEVNP